MARLVHLTRASSLRSIANAGVRGVRVHVELANRVPTVLERGVFVMPLLPDFATTHQWLRELRRWHGERMAAVHLRLPNDQVVHVGPYAKRHRTLALGAAVRWVIDHPLGAEIIVPRSIAKREIVAIRELPQLVGWKETPAGAPSFVCFCSACEPAGMPDLVRRLKASFERSVREARAARSTSAIVVALGGASTALERARGRIAPDKLLPFTRSDADRVREAAAELLGSFTWSQASTPLEALCLDASGGVRTRAAASLLQVGGAARAWSVVRAAPADTRAAFIDRLRCEADLPKAAKVLEAAVRDASADVRDRARRVSARLLDDADDVDPGVRAALERAASLA
jgi:hypothetical protein